MCSEVDCHFVDLLNKTLAELDLAIGMVKSDFDANKSKVESIVTEFSNSLKELTDHLLSKGDLKNLELLRTKVSELMDMCASKRTEAKQSLSSVVKGAAGVKLYKQNRY